MNKVLFSLEKEEIVTDELLHKFEKFQKMLFFDILQINQDHSELMKIHTSALNLHYALNLLKNVSLVKIIKKFLTFSTVQLSSF